MATLTKLKSMNDSDIQNWLKKVEKEGVLVLVYAMLGAYEDTRNCVFRNMSDRAGSLLKTEIENYEKANISSTIINQNTDILENLF
jgi:flagellar motor switch protein FliG